MISPEELKGLFIYRPDTGLLVWRVDVNPRAPAGREAGCRRPDGYRSVRIRGRMYQVHRVIWALVNGSWPEDEIDHINADRSDNRYCNLREATRSQNEANKRISRANTSGFKGVSRVPSGNWVAYYKKDQKHIHLGTFPSREQALDARKRAFRSEFGEYAMCGD